jgi:hypothetical protein
MKVKTKVKAGPRDCGGGGSGGGGKTIIDVAI